MKFNYIYLDDEDMKGTKSFGDVLMAENSSLVIKTERPKALKDQVKRLHKEKDALHGLILDLRLDEFSDGKTKASYKASTLAQEIRTRATGNKFQPFPIVLWSSEEKLKKYYQKDEGAHSLFDSRYMKDDIVDNSIQVANELVSLANGYREINNLKLEIPSRGKHLHKFLKLSDTQKTGVDAILLNYFTEGKMPVHEYARLILNEIIFSPGALIDENYLVARLGIDKDSSKDWQMFKEKIASAWSYKGPFHEAWPRWWMHLINQWWNGLKNSPASLSNLYAGERVTFIKMSTKYKNLKPVEAIKRSYSTKFWTICKALNRPLDPIDGFMIDSKPPQQWQDVEYISGEAAVKRKGYSEGIRVHPIEAERFNDLKKSIK